MREATEIATQAGPDLMDINYGCPVKTSCLSWCRISIITGYWWQNGGNDQSGRERYTPARHGKTRLGWDDNTKNVEEVAERLQDMEYKRLPFMAGQEHNCIRDEADWTLIRKLNAIRE